MKEENSSLTFGVKSKIQDPTATEKKNVLRGKTLVPRCIPEREDQTILGCIFCSSKRAYKIYHMCMQLHYNKNCAAPVNKYGLE